MADWCSCLVLAVEAQGKSVGTIEGVAKELHPLQQKFLENAATVWNLYSRLHCCGKGPLGENPDPDEETIRYWLVVPCRCTGYDKIIRAVQDAAKELAHPA